VTPKAALMFGTASLKAVAGDAAALEARTLLLAAAGRPEASVHALPDAALAGEAESLFRAFVRRRAAHEPVAYILGGKEFWSLAFAVTPDVLIPRPDSETAVMAALELCPETERALRILDLGTGSGCLLLALLSERPRAQGLGVDLSAGAIAVAAGNAHRLGLSGRARFLVSDWFSAVEGRYDVIVCNPPYIGEGELSSLAPDVARFEPRIALTPGPDGLAAYARIIPALADHLLPGGLAVFETGAGQAAAVAGLMRKAGLSALEIRADLAGIARAVCGRLG
jgi:release factor glutamine methyltransferase